MAKTSPIAKDREARLAAMANMPVVTSNPFARMTDGVTTKSTNMKATRMQIDVIEWASKSL